MNHLSKPSCCLVHYNSHNSEAQFSCEAEVSDAGVGGRSLEEEVGSSLQASGVRKTLQFRWSGEESKHTHFFGKQTHYIAIDGDASESESAQPYERQKDVALSASVTPRGSYQRPTSIIQSPEWLPDGWTTEVRIREWGNTAGTKDKYYVNPANGRRFRSRKEVMEYLETGNFSRLKRRAKAAELSSYSVTVSVAQETHLLPELASDLGRSSSHFASPLKHNPAFIQNWLIPPFVEDAVSVRHRTGDFGNFCSAGSWRSLNQQNFLDKKQTYCRSDHIPQLPVKMGIVPHVHVRPHPLEIIDLEAIPITTLSLPSAGNLSQLNSPKESILPNAETNRPETKRFNSHLFHHTANQQKHLHSVVNILGGMTHNAVNASCQVPKLGTLYGSNFYLQDICQGTDMVYTNPGKDSLGAFDTTSSLYNKKSSQVSRNSPLPDLNSSLERGTAPLLQHYQMMLPSFAENSAIGQTFCRHDENGSMVGTKIYERDQLLNSKELIEKENTTRSFSTETKKTLSNSPLGVKKLQKLQWHQERKQLELLGRTLCLQGLAFVQKELPTPYVKSKNEAQL